jgi:hypothetical protein
MSLLYLLLVFVVLLTCAALPTSLAALLADSTLLNSYAAVKPALGLGYIEYAKLIWFLRLAVALFTWASGAYILWAARSKPAARRRIMSISAALLFLMPLPFALTSQPGITRLAEPWALILSALFGLFSTLGLVLFAVYYYLFPDGSFSPGWLRWPVIVAALAILAGFIFVGLVPDSPGWAWAASLLLYFIFVLARPGISLIVVRWAQINSSHEYISLRPTGHRRGTFPPQHASRRGEIIETL